MSKLNKKASEGEKLLSHPDLTLNKENGVAFKTGPKVELMLRIVSSLISEAGAYTPGKEMDKELLIAIEKAMCEDPKYILQLAVFARNKLYLRSATTVLLGEYALSAGVSKVPEARKYFFNALQRADDITELLGYILTRKGQIDVPFKGKIPHVVKHSVAEALKKFDAYQLAKYNRSDVEVTLRDAIFLTHPQPDNDEQAKLFASIIDGTLAPPDTWEVHLSRDGSSKETWEGIIPKMGYMATLRNLRNMLESKVNMVPVLRKLSDPSEVLKSKQFPYRFLSAYKELEGVSGASRTLAALSDALDLSAQNVPDFPGISFITCDTSGTMNATLSSKSKMTRKEVGCLFGAMVHKKAEDSIVAAFASEIAPVELSYRDSTFTNMKKLFEANTHGSATNAYKVMDWLIEEKHFVDRIILFSDMLCYSSSTRMAWIAVNNDQNLYLGLKKYRQQINPNVFVYTFDLSSHGSVQFPKDDPKVCVLGGFSDKILNFIPMFERSRADMLAEIESIVPE
jgi:hypothetical protein